MNGNIFELQEPLPKEEVFDDLISAEDVKIERIVSNGQTTPTGEWYDQDQDEWVVLVQGQAELEYENGDKQRLTARDHVLIPARLRHRVVYASADPPCIWIAVFGDLV